ILCPRHLCTVGCLTRVPTYVLDGSDGEGSTYSFRGYAFQGRFKFLKAKNCLLPRTDVLGHLELKDLPKYPSGILAERINTINFIVKMALGDGNLSCSSFCGQIVYRFVEEVAPFDVKYKKDAPAGNPDYPPPSEILVMGHQFKVFVGNLPNDVSSADLKNKCSEYEEVSEARIVFKRGRPCGYRYLWMEQEDDMFKVIVGMRSQNGKKIRAEKANDSVTGLGRKDASFQLL
ncbi:28 kDa ribonucleoprotein, chloroplastic-like protein, partial [Tanacetum coccineum]